MMVTAFGLPVVPDVYSRTAGSLPAVGAVAALPASAISDSKWEAPGGPEPPQAQRNSTPDAAIAGSAVAAQASWTTAARA